MLRARRVAIAVAIIALTASVAAPAQADKATFKDNRRDMRSGMNIYKIAVKNNGPWIKVRSKHRNLKKGPKVAGSGAFAYFDFLPKRRGPEAVLGGPVSENGGYSLTKVRRWKPMRRIANCKFRYKVNYKREAIRFHVKRRCLARMYSHRVGKIRVAVAASQSRRYAPGLKTDWAPKRHRLYPAVRRG